jgi:hypothetical protein
MSFAARLCLFAALAIAGVVAWQWNAAMDSTHDVTELAVQQFQNSNSVPDRLQQASLAQNWWPLVWPTLLVLLGAVMFWDDVERWWKQENEGSAS